MTEPAGSPRSLYVVLPGDVDTPTGGNVYDRRVVVGLETEYGWEVLRSDIPGRWPLPDDDAVARLAAVLAEVPAGGVVFIDGLVACGVPAVIEQSAGRLRFVVVVHLPLPDETGLAADMVAQLAARERRTLRAAAAVIATSEWAGRRLRTYDLGTGRVHVAEPGTDVIPLQRPPRDRAAVPELLCVAAVTPRKDQLTMVRALALISHLPWRCTLVGPLDRSPEYVRAVRDELSRSGLAERVRLVGPLTAPEVVESYDAADLLVLASRTETFGMVITEALSRGLPVVITAAGAAAETLGEAPDGTVPGLVVPPADVAALGDALARFLGDARLRDRLAAAAVARRTTLRSWADTTRRVAQVLDSVAAKESVT